MADKKCDCTENYAICPMCNGEFKRTIPPEVEELVKAVEDFRNQMRVQAMECLPLPAEYDTLMEKLAVYKQTLPLTNNKGE